MSSGSHDPHQSGREARPELRARLDALAHLVYALGRPPCLPLLLLLLGGHARGRARAERIG